MDASTRIKVLSRLSESSTPIANDALRRAFDLAAKDLAEETSYESLEFSLEAMAIVSARYSYEATAALDGFIRSIEARQLTNPPEYEEVGLTLSKYRNAYTLMSKGLDVLSGLRYLETSSVVATLLWASAHPEESVRKAATTALDNLAKYNLSVYSGQGLRSGRGVGAAPQLEVIASLEKRDDSELGQYLGGVLTLLEGLLSTSMQSTKWSASAVTLSRAATPADAAVVHVRARSISLLQRLYGMVETKAQRLSVIRVLNSAVRAEGRVAVDDAYGRMISENTQAVLAFYAEIVKGADLQIVQKIEHNSYWIHFHAFSEEVCAAALEVKKVIDLDEEYKIYKTLVGFEGVFGDWARSQRDASHELSSQSARSKIASTYIPRIADEGFEVWRQRVLRFAQTESNDLATFPVFYEFLGEVATNYPKFALELLVDHSKTLERFLIPLLRGLWDSEVQDELLRLMRGWMRDAQLSPSTLLYASVKVFLSTKAVDVKFLEELLERGASIKDAAVLRQVVSVAISRFDTVESGAELKALFLRALWLLTELKDASWVNEVWFRKEAKSMVALLSPEERRDVFANLLCLPQVEYQAQDVLGAIAVHAPLEVVEFFCARIYGSHDTAQSNPQSEGVEFEELPFEFDGLQDVLSKYPGPTVRVVLANYRRDVSLFEFRGAKLLHNIFPQFSEGFQAELMRLVQEGGVVEHDFVVGVLRAYRGEAFIQPVAKELVKRVPLGSPLLSEVEIALYSTGVVSGDYGMAEAYERKRLQLLDWLSDPSDKVRDFAKSYVSNLAAMRDGERTRADESIALRRFEYGED